MSTDSNVKPVTVINVVGLTPSLLGESTPRLNKLLGRGFLAELKPVFPAVTMTAQSSMLTGLLPRDHGIVGNGWHYRDLAETRFWHQADYLVQGRKIWDYAREQIPGFSCAKVFWQSNMYSAVDYSVTLRPIYPADGRKIPALYTYPKNLYQGLEEQLGDFPYFNYWGPAAGVQSSQWIAGCAKEIFDKYRPTLQLVYLPHLDYPLQKLGPDHPDIAGEVATVDRIAGDLIEHVAASGSDVLVVSEYGIERADRCVHINRILREAGFLEVREELGKEMFDAGASRAFAIVDHQIAHIYIRNPDDIVPVAKLLESVPGIEKALDAAAKREVGIDHPRSGELIAVADPGYWFSYYFWLDDQLAPDYAPTVDIHRKPGYDPGEMFIDPGIRFPRWKIARRVMQKKLGLRTLMDVLPLDASGLVHGSHGRLTTDASTGPLLIGSRTDLARDQLSMTDVKDLILRHWVE